MISLNFKVFLLYEDENGLSLKTILVIADGMVIMAEFLGRVDYPAENLSWSFLFKA